MLKTTLRSRGSALLVVLFLSSAVLVIFSAFYSVMHESTKARIGDSSADGVTLSDAIDGKRYGVDGPLPSGTSLVSQSASGSNYVVFVASGSSVELSRIASGSITASLVDGGAVRIVADDGLTTASGVLFDSLSLDTSNTSTGTVTLTTLGGYSKVSIGTNSIVRPKKETYLLQKDVANTTVHLRTFEIER